MNILPFTPVTNGTVNLSVTGTSGTVTLAKTAIGQQIMVTSPPTNAAAYIEFGTSSVAAVAATSTPIQPGAIMVFTVGPTVTTAAAIGASGTTLYFTSGQGS